MSDMGDKVMGSKAHTVAALVAKAMEISLPLSTEQLQASALGGALETVLQAQAVAGPFRPGLLGTIDHYEIHQLLGSDVRILKLKKGMRR